MPSTVPAWSIADMKSAAAYTNFKESAAACKLWESVVQYDARVSANFQPALASAKQHELQTIATAAGTCQQADCSERRER